MRIKTHFYNTLYLLSSMHFDPRESQRACHGRMAADSSMLLGYMLTYYSVQSTFPAACTTLALHGMAFSLVYATAIRSAQVSQNILDYLPGHS